VIEHYTDVPVLGAVHNDPQLEIIERHLGLMPSNESHEARTRIANIAERVARQVDLERLQAVAGTVSALTPPSSSPLPPEGKGSRPLRASHAAPIRLAIARDEAFGFYYPGDLEALRSAGAELVPFDTLRDAVLPPADGLFIGGGFPEMYLEQLSANRGLRDEIRSAIEHGLPAYAECGGLMYLSRSIRWKDRCAEMVGVIAADAVMEDRPQGRGYVRLRETGFGPWPQTDVQGKPAVIAAHEFHYSRLADLPAGQTWAYDVMRGSGIDGQHDGLVHKNLLACYCHLRDLDNNHWARRFVDFIRAVKNDGRARSTAG